MATNPGNGINNASSPSSPSGVPQPQLDPNQKTLSVWSKPVDEKDKVAGHPTISEAVGMIKTEDFANIANTPCARTGFLNGIGAGFGMAGLRFILGGNIAKCTNWAAGFFIVGSMASYEYCQYLRRCEKRDMKRHIEVINDGRKEHAKKLIEEKKEKQQRLEEEEKAAQKSWYKFW